MNFYVAAKSDIGRVKKINQDSYCVKSATTAIGNLVMAVVCDGMGGLEQGEVASTSVVMAFQKWFETRLPKLISHFQIEQVKNDWTDLVEHQNKKLLRYGEEQNIKLGTTLTAILLVDEYMLLSCHVGDSRLYRITQEAEVLTEDHTWIAREIKQRRITEEEAKNHPNRNMLLQCIGVLEHVVPDYSVRRIYPEEVYMLCTDGFRHNITKEELQCLLAPEHLTGEKEIQQRLLKLIDMNKYRGEKDNITAIVVKTIQSEGR